MYQVIIINGQSEKKIQEVEYTCFRIVVSTNPQSQVHNIKENGCNNESLHPLINS